MVDPTDETTGAPARMPDPGIRFRYVAAMWSSCEDWRTRGSLIRLVAGKWWNRITGPHA